MNFYFVNALYQQVNLVLIAVFEWLVEIASESFGGTGTQILVSPIKPHSHYGEPDPLPYDALAAFEAPNDNFALDMDVIADSESDEENCYPTQPVKHRIAAINYASPNRERKRKAVIASFGDIQVLVYAEPDPLPYDALAAVEAPNDNLALDMDVIADNDSGNENYNPIQPAKHRRRDFFTNNTLSQRRQEVLLNHRHVSINKGGPKGKQKQLHCLWCCCADHTTLPTEAEAEANKHYRYGYKTSNICSICLVPLCTVKRHGSEFSCFEQFHLAEKLNNPCKHQPNETQNGTYK